MNFPKLRVWAAAVLFSISLVCFVYADRTGGGPWTMKDCDDQRAECETDCNNIWSNNKGRRDTCKRGCTHDYMQCVFALAPKGGTPPPRIGGLPTPTPRKGPGNISGLPESNPTATPKKGPGKTGTSGIGHSSPTPTPSAGPVLLKKSGTPTPTPKKGHH